jgi:hypothetical protein
MGGSPATARRALNRRLWKPDSGSLASSAKTRSPPVSPCHARRPLLVGEDVGHRGRLGLDRLDELQCYWGPFVGVIPQVFVIRRAVEEMNNDALALGGNNCWDQVTVSCQ